MFNNSNRPGQIPWRTQKLRVVNRGGTTAVKLGDVMALDLGATDTDTQAKNGVGGQTLASITDAIFANIVNVAAAPGNALICVVTDLLSGAGADNTEVEVCISGRCQAKVAGTDWSTANASFGDAITADITGANRQLIAALADVNRGKQGVIIDDVAANLSVSGSKVVDVLLLGWGSSVGGVGV